MTDRREAVLQWIRENWYTIYNNEGLVNIGIGIYSRPTEKYKFNVIFHTVYQGTLTSAAQK